MKSTFEVWRRFSDGTEAEPMVVPVTALPPHTRMDRRVFFRAGITLSGVAAMLAGCGSPDHTAATVPSSRSDPLPAGSPATPTTEPPGAPDVVRPPVVKKTAPRRHPRPKPPSGGDDTGRGIPPYRSAPSYHSAPSYRPYGGYTGGTRLGETIERPCTPEPVPPGYICTCNCVAR